VEGRLLAMLEGVETLTLGLLNEATCAWMEMEYNRTVHSETRCRPVDRYVEGPEVGRPCPSGETLRLAFRKDVQRTQRRSDGTISLESVRFEIPNRLRHLAALTVRYARWNLGCVHVVDPRTDALPVPIHPLDKVRNADGQRRVLDPVLPTTAPPATPPGDMAPLLRKLIPSHHSR
jgi:hypothetical protein